MGLQPYYGSSYLADVPASFTTYYTYLADVPATLDARVGGRVVVAAGASLVAVVALDAWLERVGVDGGYHDLSRCRGG